MQLHQRWLVVAFVVLLGLGGLTLPHAQAGTAGVWYVTLDGADSHDCRTPATPCASVGAVLAKVSFQAGDTILVEWGTYHSNPESAPFIHLTQNVTLSGGWNRTFTQRDENSTFWASAMTALVVAPDISVTLQAIQVRGGLATFSAPPAAQVRPLQTPFTVPPTFRVRGERPTPPSVGMQAPLPYGGIHNQGILRMEDSSAGGRSGFAILNEGTLLMVGGGAAGDGDSSLINRGQATLEARASISNGFAPSCGGIANYGTLTMTQGTLKYNHAYEWVGGGLCNLGSATLRDSLVAYNSAYYPYEGIPAEAAGIYNYGSLTLTNVLVYRNEAQGRGGGIFNLGQVWLFNSTITRNIAQDGTGLTNLPAGHITSSHTLLAHNELSLPDGQGADCLGTLHSAGYSLLRDPAQCDFRPATGDLVGRDPLLFWRSLPYFPGERVIYHPLLYQSPAINAGDPAGCRDERGALLLADARGTPRWGPCDIGAYEWHPDFDPLHYQLLPVVSRSD